MNAPAITRSFLRQFRLRLRDRRFWIIQVLVIAISIAHTTLEATHALGVLPDLYLLPVSTYFIPVVYAGLNFGLEGAIPTAIWCCLLVIPEVVLFHHGWERLGVTVQLAIMVAVAVLIARRVERETTAKRRAEEARRAARRAQRHGRGQQRFARPLGRAARDRRGDAREGEAGGGMGSLRAGRLDRHSAGREPGRLTSRAASAQRRLGDRRPRRHRKRAASARLG